MILITGFTGNTGMFVLEKLLGIYKPNEIVGITRDTGFNNSVGINVENFALGNDEDLAALFEKYMIETIIHIANIRYSPSIMELANEYSIRKVILIHTTGVYSRYRSYSSLYKEIEEKILQNTYSNTSYTILRPTMIYGNERDHNMHKLVKFLSKYPAFPVFGDGSALMQPVHVEDLAEGIVLAHESSISSNHDYDLSGGNVVTYKHVLNTISKELNKKVQFILIPMKLAIFAAKLYNILFKKAIITVEQVERLQEDKAYSNEKAKRELGFNPRSFEEGIAKEIRLLQEKGLIKR